MQQIWLFPGAASQSVLCRVPLLLSTGFCKGTDTTNYFLNICLSFAQMESVLVSDFRWDSVSDWVSPF